MGNVRRSGGRRADDEGQGQTTKSNGGRRPADGGWRTERSFYSFLVISHQSLYIHVIVNSIFFFPQVKTIALFLLETLFTNSDICFFPHANHHSYFNLKQQNIAAKMEHLEIEKICKRKRSFSLVDGLD